MENRNPEKSFKVMLVDNHDIARQGLAKLIAQQKNLLVCAEAAGPEQVLQALDETCPDLAIVNISLETHRDIEIIKMIKAACQYLPILALSIHDQPGYIIRALEAGATGYVAKQEPVGNIIAAVYRLLDGQTYLTEKTDVNPMKAPYSENLEKIYEIKPQPFLDYT